MQAEPRDEIGQKIGGVWLPISELHLVDMMTTGKSRREIDGRLTYQYHKLEAALKYVPAERRHTALDIGAHVGLWSMWLVHEFASVHAFEPVPEHRELFFRNVSELNVVMHQVALGEREGVTMMEIPLETTGNAHVAIGERHPGTRHVPNPDAQRQVGPVKVTRLDLVKGLGAVDFIKIDVEGFERAVVAGGERLIRECKPVIVVEQKGNESAYGDGRDAAAKLLMRWGMKPLKVMAGDWIMGW